MRCKNVELTDFSLVIGGHFAIIAEGVENMYVDGILIDTNRDAFDVDCCKDVTVRNSVFNSLTDDGLVMKSSYGAGIFMPLENVLIEDCRYLAMMQEASMQRPTRTKSLWLRIAVARQDV